MPPIAQADRRAGPLPLPLGVHRAARGHRDRRHRARAHVLALLRRAVPASAAGGLRRACSARSSPGTSPPSGLSTPAGRAARPATAATGCRSRRRGRCSTRRSRAASTTSAFRTDEVFGFAGPARGARASRLALLDPRSTWRDPDAYDAKARELAADVRRQLREVRGRRSRGRRRRASPS